MYPTWDGGTLRGKKESRNRRRENSHGGYGSKWELKLLITGSTTFPDHRLHLISSDGTSASSVDEMYMES